MPDAAITDEEAWDNQTKMEALKAEQPDEIHPATVKQLSEVPVKLCNPLFHASLDEERILLTG